MSNELIFILSSLIDILFVFFAARRGVNWLLGSIIVNLILVAIFGPKLITMFGLVTNAGNTFYACVFLATHFILEKYGRSVGLKITWFGAGFILFFTVMSQFSTNFVGLSMSDEANGAITTLFTFSLRITIASVVAYVFAQYINVVVYEWIKKRTTRKFLWIRSNGANIIGQFGDSIVFFSIAFFDLPGHLLVQAILVGWSFKTIVVFLGTPFLYLNSYLETKKI